MAHLCSLGVCRLPYQRSHLHGVPLVHQVVLLAHLPLSHHRIHHRTSHIHIHLDVLIADPLHNPANSAAIPTAIHQPIAANPVAII